jgi:DNA-binding NtrC family response regulator
VIACSQRSLERRVAEGAFREDLYFRLARLLLHVPPLRQRLDDLPFLARSILGSVPHARAGVALDAAALERLRQHAWRGNIRELRNVLERAVLHAEDATIGAADLRLDSASAEPHSSGDAVATLADLERLHIERVLASTGYDVPEAARRLGIPRSTLYQRIREYRIALRPR